MESAIELFILIHSYLVITALFYLPHIICLRNQAVCPAKSASLLELFHQRFP